MDILDQALGDRQVVMAPAVLTELLSDPQLDSEVGSMLAGLPLLAIQDGFWERAGRLRAEVIAKLRKARLGDALTAQFSIDHRFPLLTRDRDLHAFAAATDLEHHRRHLSDTTLAVFNGAGRSRNRTLEQGRAVVLRETECSWSGPVWLHLTLCDRLMPAGGLQ